MLKKLIILIGIAFVVGNFYPPEPEAKPAEPEIHYFRVTGCRFCDDGLSFLKRYREEDKRIVLHDYDVLRSEREATLFVRVVDAIGLTDPRVPMTIIGRRVIIGFDTDETTGWEIRQVVEQCRIVECPDMLRSIIHYDPEVVTSSTDTWVVERRYAGSARDLP